MLNQNGDIINPVWGDPEILYYRRITSWGCGFLSTFDIRGKDCAGDPKGLNSDPP